MTSLSEEYYIKKNYIQVNKRFFNKLLVNSWNPMIYITKKMNQNESNLYNTITGMFNEQLTETIKFLDTEDVKKITYEETQNRQNTFKKLENKLHEIANNKSPDIEEHVKSIYTEGAKKGCEDLNKKLQLTDVDKYSLFFINQYAFDKIKELTNDVNTSIRTEIWRGVSEGLGIGELKRNIKSTGIGDLKVGKNRVLTANQRAEMIARTETIRAKIAGTLQNYAKYGIEEVDILISHVNPCATCIENNSHNPHTLLEVSNLLPAHPNCKCTVTAHINEGQIYDSKLDPNPIIVDMTTDKSKRALRFNDLDNIISNEYYYGKEDIYVDYSKEDGYEILSEKDLKIYQNIAKEYGLNFYQNKNGTYFHDEEHNTKIYLKDDINNIINNDKPTYADYTIREVIEAYENAPTIYKITSNKIELHNLKILELGSPKGTYDKNTDTIHLFRSSFEGIKTSDGGLNYSLYHEMAHSFDNNIRQKMFDYYATSEEYRKIMFLDKKYQMDGLKKRLYGSTRYGVSNEVEDFAEAMTIVLSESLSNINGVEIRLSNSEKVNINKWKEYYPHRYEFCRKILSENGIKFPNNNIPHPETPKTIFPLIKGKETDYKIPRNGAYVDVETIASKLYNEEITYEDLNNKLHYFHIDAIKNKLIEVESQFNKINIKDIEKKLDNIMLMENVYELDFAKYIDKFGIAKPTDYDETKLLTKNELDILNFMRKRK